MRLLRRRDQTLVRRGAEGTSTPRFCLALDARNVGIRAEPIAPRDAGPLGGRRIGAGGGRTGHRKAAGGDRAKKSI